MPTSELVGQLIEALRCLPGVGPKSAQRMALHLLERNREGARHLSEVMQAAIELVGHCARCRTLTESELCAICSDDSRDHRVVCVVESPADVLAVDQATPYRGDFFVLMGRLSPIDGIGPEDIGLDRLAERMDRGEISEVIVATNPTVEGEATAHYVSEMAKRRDVRASRLAHGIPLGGELESIDRTTLAHAFGGRQRL